jgi:hypothetical protein
MADKCRNENPAQNIAYTQWRVKYKIESDMNKLTDIAIMNKSAVNPATVHMPTVESNLNRRDEQQKK